MYSTDKNSIMIKNLQDQDQKYQQELIQLNRQLQEKKLVQKGLYDNLNIIQDHLYQQQLSQGRIEQKQLQIQENKQKKAERVYERKHQINLNNYEVDYIAENKSLINQSKQYNQFIDQDMQAYQYLKTIDKKQKQLSTYIHKNPCSTQSMSKEIRIIDREVRRLLSDQIFYQLCVNDLDPTIRNLETKQYNLISLQEENKKLMDHVDFEIKQHIVEDFHHQFA